MDNIFKDFNIKKHWYMPVGGAVIIGLIICIFIVLGNNENRQGNQSDDLGNSINNEDNRQEDVKFNRILNESLDLSSLENMELREQLVDKILLGNNSLYEIDNKYYVILTTGTKSKYGIEYEANIDPDGTITIDSKLSDIEEQVKKIRYKVIEVENDQVIVHSPTSSSITTNTRSGLCPIIIYKDMDGTHYINSIEGTSSDYNGVTMPGIYMATLDNGDIESTQPLNNCEIHNCRAGSKVAGSGSMYNIYLSDNTQLQVSTTEELVKGKIYNLELSYNSITGIISVNTK